MAQRWLSFAWQSTSQDSFCRPSASEESAFSSAAPTCLRMDAEARLTLSLESGYDIYSWVSHPDPFACHTRYASAAIPGFGLWLTEYCVLVPSHACFSDHRCNSVCCESVLNLSRHAFLNVTAARGLSRHAAVGASAERARTLPCRPSIPKMFAESSHDVGKCCCVRGALWLSLPVEVRVKRTRQGVGLAFLAPGPCAPFRRQSMLVDSPRW